MVNVKVLQDYKRVDKQPAAPIIKPTKDESIKVTVSPKGSPKSAEEEIQVLRTRNKILSDALKAIKQTAEAEGKKHYDLVWLARNRGRYPLHQARKRIEEEHGEELKKLHTPEGDFVHGIHAGILAASRMFEKHADILHVNEHDELTDELLSAVAEHQKAVEEAKETFPHVAVDTKPPSED